MNVKYTVNKDLNFNELLNAVDKSNASLGTFLATSWWKLYTPYVPMQSGALFGQVVLSVPWEITHTVPYANRQYNGYFNFSTNKHPLATRKWDEAAKNAGKADILAQDVVKYLRMRGLV